MRRSPELPPAPSSDDWTVRSLRDHLLRVIWDTQERLNDHIQSAHELAQQSIQEAEKAVSKAEAATERRFRKRQ